MIRYWLSVLTLAAVGCAGTNGTNGKSCTVTSNPDGSATISCTDGTTTTIKPGTVGASGTTGTVGATGPKGTDCTVATANGVATITCPGASTSVSQGLPPCGTLAGNFTVIGPNDLVTFQAAGCTEIDGNLIINDNYITDVVSSLGGLSSLTTVTGSVDIESMYGGNENTSDPLQITTLDGLQNLATVGGYLDIDGTTWLTDINLASLTTVSGQTLTAGHAIEIDSNSPLASIEMPLLATVGGPIDIEYDYGDGDGLVSISLPALTTIPGDLILNADSFLTTLTVGNLTTIQGNLTVDVMAALTTLDFPKLISVTGNIEIDHNVNLDAVTFDAAPVTIGGTVDISDDQDLCTTPDPSTFSATPTCTDDGTACP